MVGHIEDIGGAACCRLKMPFDRSGPWTCPQCGLIHGWPCSPEPAAPTEGVEFWLAQRLADARVMLQNEAAWLKVVEEYLVEVFSSHGVRR
jgi:hypothetical protein